MDPEATNSEPYNSEPTNARTVEPQTDSGAKADAAPAPPGAALSEAERERLRGEILEALKVVRDPEIPLNVVDLGLIYKVEVGEGGKVAIDMTLTSMGCPVMDMIQADAELAAMSVAGVEAVTVEFVWSPPWSPQKMSEDGRKQMRMFGFNF